MEPFLINKIKMKVYEIDVDINNMRALDSKIFNYEKEIKWFQGISMNDIFFPDNEKFVVEKLKAKYMEFYAGASRFVLTPASFQILGTNLSKYGEFYKCEIVNAPPPNNYAYFFNILTILNPYDVKRTEWSFDYKGKKDRPITPVFKKKKVTEALFIIPKGHKDYSYYKNYFCTDGLLPPEEEFYHIYQNSGLKGLRFKEIELT